MTVSWKSGKDAKYPTGSELKRRGLSKSWELNCTAGLDLCGGAAERSLESCESGKRDEGWKL